MRDLTETELYLVSGGQTNSFTGTLSASTPPPEVSALGSGTGAVFDLRAEANLSPASASTSATVTESNSTP
jgi:hypothetical protein